MRINGMDVDPAAVRGAYTTAPEISQYLEFSETLCKCQANIQRQIVASQRGKER